MITVGNYRINYAEKNFTVECFRGGTKSDGTPAKEKWCDKTYHSNIEQCLKKLKSLGVQDFLSGDKEFEEIMDFYTELEFKIDELADEFKKDRNKQIRITQNHS